MADNNAVVGSTTPTPRQKRASKNSSGRHGMIQWSGVSVR